MKVLVVTNLYPRDDRPSWGTFVKEQVESLRTCCPELTVDVFVVEGYRSRLEYVRSMLRLPGIIKRGRYDIVHAHYGLTLLALIFVTVPVVVTFHGSDLLVSPAKHLSKLLARKASRCIVVARRLRDELGYGDVIPCGIGVESFAIPPDHAGAVNRRPTGCLRILFPANPAVKVKDYGLFQAVCQELEGRGTRVERVHLMNVNRADVPKVFWNCDLMLLTSLSEGSPTVIKEAIAAKLPFVSVDVGDVKEWAGLVAFGVVAPDRDPKTIADAVSALLTRINDRPSLDNSNCLEAIDMAKIAGRTRRIYDEILTKRL
ncbi:glycosyltransferase [Geobacter argillaceus]|uniref:Glycosyltransferase involved in cell wall biosynthesis n=1 Tax=Geobacter argillaceus TaxID=345631 RepID=A0A562VMN8_9BACT|nr:glycosyltransferase [Geobacter argillaceus]TWJ19062.1 glycosyltransferase involved in cell wall biosynthesis [Geobacter argillaceus]